MGFHNSAKPSTGFVHGNTEQYHDNHSASEHIVNFRNGHSWTFPSAIAYYIIDCGWQPPELFVEDVLNARVSSYLWMSHCSGHGDPVKKKGNVVSFNRVSGRSTERDSLQYNDDIEYFHENLRLLALHQIGDLQEKITLKHIFLKLLN
jgi:hypothetical protein